MTHEELERRLQSSVVYPKGVDSHPGCWAWRAFIKSVTPPDAYVDASRTYSIVELAKSGAVEPETLWAMYVLIFDPEIVPIDAAFALLSDPWR
jgi:hypothetical protein